MYAGSHIQQRDKHTLAAVLVSTGCVARDVFARHRAHVHTASVRRGRLSSIGNTRETSPGGSARYGSEPVEWGAACSCTHHNTV